MDHRVRRGLPASGRPRYGYAYHRATAVGGRLCPQGCAIRECVTGYVVDPATGPILAEMYRRYAAGDGLAKVAHWLNATGAPTPKGAYWTPGSVSEKLDSGFGAGFVYAKGELHPGVHEPVVGPDVWQTYRDRRCSLAPVAPRSRESRWDLAGIARCGRCGGPMTASSQGRDGSLYLLRCNAERLRGKSVCAGTSIKRETVESAVLTWLGQYAAPIDAATSAAVRARPPEPPPAPEASRTRLEQAVEAKRRGLERLADAVARGMPVPEYLDARARCQAGLDAAAEDLAALDRAAPQDAPSPAQVHGLLRTWAGLTVRARRDVLRELLASVVVHPRDRHPARVEIVPAARL
jgi:hypothetical protein